MTVSGTSASTARSEASPDVSDAALRTARRDRVFDAMSRAGLDLLVLGRRDTVAYTTGARSLWTAGTRPPGPACVLVEARRSIHLLSTWEAGVPPEIPFEHLYGLTWNPAIMAASLRTIPGFLDARRVGIDALSPGTERLLARLLPDAELILADGLLAAARARKLPAEVERIRTAVAIATASVEAAAAALAAEATPAEARAAAIRKAAASGATVPSSGVMIVPEGGRRVHVDVGLLVDGYDGGLGRTVHEAPGGSSEAATAVQRRLIEACRPQATAAGLRDAAGGASRWLVRGTGMGFEPPLVTGTLGGNAVIEQGMALSVEVEVEGVRRRDLVLVAADATERLTPSNL
jgi:Xaa-Pro dipeptidase